MKPLQPKKAANGRSRLAEQHLDSVNDDSERATTIVGRRARHCIELRCIAFGRRFNDTIPRNRFLRIRFVPIWGCRQKRAFSSFWPSNARYPFILERTRAFWLLQSLPPLYCSRPFSCRRGPD
jgi:hypothetical protein